MRAAGTRQKVGFNVVLMLERLQRLIAECRLRDCKGRSGKRSGINLEQEYKEVVIYAYEKCCIIMCTYAFGCCKSNFFWSWRRWNRKSYVKDYGDSQGGFTVNAKLWYYLYAIFSDKCSATSAAPSLLLPHQLGDGVIANNIAKGAVSEVI
ncbi:hypothetical protein VNO80_18728 [Phaseolus coccineus]|uniref:Uncharacterized protein n=1 Tax=Phaseolus coccineus TaxID=3886 RepID=A0AAN9QZZ8_PHACN